MSRDIAIYTSSACTTTGLANWSFVVTDGKHTRTYSGMVSECNPNRAELIAVLEALKHINHVYARGTTIKLYSNSFYVRNGITKWLTGWLKNNWITDKREPVKNTDLWQEVNGFIALHSIDWRWQKIESQTSIVRARVLRHRAQKPALVA